MVAQAEGSYVGYQILRPHFYTFLSIYGIWALILSVSDQGQRHPHYAPERLGLIVSLKGTAWTLQGSNYGV